MWLRPRNVVNVFFCFLKCINCTPKMSIRFSLNVDFRNSIVQLIWSGAIHHDIQLKGLINFCFWTSCTIVWEKYNLIHLSSYETQRDKYQEGLVDFLTCTFVFLFFKLKIRHFFADQLRVKTSDEQIDFPRLKPIITCNKHIQKFCN